MPDIVSSDFFPHQKKLLGFSGPEANQDGDRLFLGRQFGRLYWEEINRSSKTNFPIDAGIGVNMA